MMHSPDVFSEWQPAGFDGQFHWDFLKPAWAPYEGSTSTRIEPMDIDATVEKNGHLLLFETKGEGVPVPQGQRLTLEALVKTGRCHVILLRAKRPEDISSWEIWYLENGRVYREIQRGDADALVRICRSWFEWACVN